MKREEVKAKAPNLTDEELTAIMDLHSKDIGKKVEKIGELEAALETKKKEIADKDDAIKKLEAAGNDVAKIQKELNDMKEAEANRKAAEEKAEAERKTADRFKTAAGENVWRDELTEKAMLEEFRNAVNDEGNKGKGDKEIFEALTKDKDYFKSSHEVKIPSAGGGEHKKYTREQVEKMSPDEINKNWDDIKESLKGGVIK